MIKNFYQTFLQCEILIWSRISAPLTYNQIQQTDIRKSLHKLFQFKIFAQILSEIQYCHQMGLLSDLGQVLSPQQLAQLMPFLKQLGVKQFLYILKKYKNWQKTTKPTIIKWGQQIEGHFLIQNQNKQLQLCLQPLSQEYSGVDFPLVLEYGRWMFEMTPTEPHSTQCDFSQIIETIKKKYQVLQSKSRIALTIPNIPFLGIRNPQQQFDNTITQSIYINDKHISNHLRFRNLTKNIRLRRGQKVQINVPIFIDKNTNKQELAKTEPNPDYIYMDAMAFGMGMSCLQCTFSTKNLDHARYLYDQMHVISPFMLAVSAGTPFYKGKIANWDVRWKTLQASVDCRNSEQRDPKNPKYLSTSRYSPATLFIWPGQFNKKEYNDLSLNINQKFKEYIWKEAKQNGIEMDQFLLDHVANIFKRDLLIGHQKFKTMTQEQYSIFQMLNGTNWNSVRLKIPIDDDIGWRVQFRTMEVQLTAEENSAFSLFIHFFTRALHKENKVNFYMPMSVVMENFQRAHVIDAVRKQKFFFRKNIFDHGQPIIQEMTLHQIFFGTEDFKGLYNFVKQMLFSQCSKCEQSCPKFKKIVNQVGQFLFDITSGKRLTLAQWMRNYVDKHPDYTHNSILPKKTMDDLLLTLNQISKGTFKDQNFSPIFSL